MLVFYLCIDQENFIGVFYTNLSRHYCQISFNHLFNTGIGTQVLIYCIKATRNRIIHLPIVMTSQLVREDFLFWALLPTNIFLVIEIIRYLRKGSHTKLLGIEKTSKKMLHYLDAP